MSRPVLVSLIVALQAVIGAAADPLLPGTRVLLDAHNAYPENGLFADRIDRALSTGIPLAIEQDLIWYQDPATGVGRSVVSHGKPITGREPGLREHFFERVRPIVERAIQENRRESWPILTLNLDFKSDEAEHHAAVWKLLGEYEAWLCTAERSAARGVQPIRPGPVLVLVGEPGAPEQAGREQDFHDNVPVGGRLRVFGGVQRTAEGLPASKTNYRRWWNNSWSRVEPEGQPKAGEWTPEDERRLTRAVRAAHDAGLWIRFYTLDGYDPADNSGGWGSGYNFGSIEAVRVRWRAAIRAGVDFVAVDQYEEFARELKNTR